jgi:hypothetical protein
MNKPKNVFEEIYAAEMSAAEQHQNTPLSNTDYFRVSASDYKTYRGRTLETSTAKEGSKDTSPFTIAAEYTTNKDTGYPFWTPFNREYNLIQKLVQIDSEFLYRGLNIEIQYRYIVLKDGGYEGIFEEFAEEEGFYVYYSGAITGDESISVDDFLAFGISESELEAQIEKNLDNILNYWVDNYSKSKFKHNDFGVYYFDGNRRFSRDEKIEALIKRLRENGMSSQEAKRLIFSQDKTELYNKVIESESKADFSH